MLSVDDYRKVPYASHAHCGATPSAAAVVATLFGVEAPDVRTARVLEVGCAGGGHLVPLGARFSNSTFLGVDPVEAHVQQASRLIDDVGLANVRIECRGLEDLGPDDGEFDYIIAHGVYSWIPVELAQRLLEVVSERLAPGGVAYVSYNTLPGWHFRRVVRDAMTFHTDQYTDPHRRIEQARALLDFMASTGREGSTLKQLLEQERSILDKHGDYYLFHDHLSAINEPVYFTDFVARADEVGLQYLGESNVGKMYPLYLPDEVQSAVGRLSRDFIRSQQYLDHFENRSFRASLLVHNDRVVDRTIDATRLAEMYASTTVGLDEEMPLALGPVDLKDRLGRQMCTDDVFIVAAWSSMLERCPEYVHVRELADLAVARVLSAGHQPPADPLSELCKNLAYGTMMSLVDLSTHLLGSGTGGEQCPKAISVARAQVAEGDRTITTLRHEEYRLDPFECRLVGLCDGLRSRSELSEILAQDVRERRLRLTSDGVEQSIDYVIGTIDDIVDARLLRLGRMGALSAPGFSA